jgi:hypothetical protein
VLADGKSAASGDGTDQRLEIIALKEPRPTALTTGQQVLLAPAGGPERLAAFGLMYVLDQAKLPQLLESAVDADEAE